MKLEEGSRYIFKVEKQIDFDSRCLWVLAGPDKKKYLLDCNDYSGYNIKAGMELNCRLDKINCKGEAFLEPLHPYYREGSEYEFILRSKEKRIDDSGTELDVAILDGKHASGVVVPMEYFKEGMPQAGARVSLLIDRIIKGIIKVTVTGWQEAPREEEDNKYYDFLIVGESRGLDGKDYFVLKDAEGNKHTMLKHYYTHYGFSVGDSIRGRYMRYKEGHGIKVEPESPFFTPGKIYDFTVKGFLTVSEGMEKIMVLEDIYSFEHHIEPLADAKTGDKLSYRVQKMRKGWPFLEKV